MIKIYSWKNYLDWKTNLQRGTDPNFQLMFIYTIRCVNIRRSPPPQARGRGLNLRRNKRKLINYIWFWIIFDQGKRSRCPFLEILKNKRDIKQNILEILAKIRYNPPAAVLEILECINCDRFWYFIRKFEQTYKHFFLFPISDILLNYVISYLKKTKMYLILSS